MNNNNLAFLDTFASNYDNNNNNNNNNNNIGFRPSEFVTRISE